MLLAKRDTSLKSLTHLHELLTPSWDWTILACSHIPGRQTSSVVGKTVSGVRARCFSGRQPSQKVGGGLAAKQKSNAEETAGYAISTLELEPRFRLCQELLDLEIMGHNSLQLLHFF